MKRLFNFAKTKIVNFIRWLWSECKDWRTLVLLAVVCLVIGFPVWGGYMFWFIFRFDWLFWVASACWAFWMLPGAPFFALSVSVTLVIKRFAEKKMKKRAAMASSMAELIANEMHAAEKRAEEQLDADVGSDIAIDTVREDGKAADASSESEASKDAKGDTKADTKAE